MSASAIWRRPILVNDLFGMMTVGDVDCYHPCVAPGRVGNIPMNNGMMKAVTAMRRPGGDFRASDDPRRRDRLRAKRHRWGCEGARASVGFARFRCFGMAARDYGVSETARDFARGSRIEKKK